MMISEVNYVLTGEILPVNITQPERFRAGLFLALLGIKGDENPLPYGEEK